MLVVSRVMTALGVVLLVLGTAAGVVNRQVLDSDRFLTHVDAVRADADVARAVGRLLTDRVLVAQPDLTAVRPLLESAAASVVASPSSAAAAHAAVAPLQRSLTGEGHGTVVLRLADVGAVVLASVRTLSPRFEATVPGDLDVRLSQLGGAGLGREVVWQAHLTAWVARLAPGLGLLLLFAAGWVRAGPARRLRGALARLGAGAVAAGVGLGLVLVVVGTLVGRVDETVLRGALARAVWSELSGPFWTAAALLAASGALLVLATRREGLPRLRSVVDGLRSGAPGHPTQPASAGALLVLGAALVVRPLEVLGFAARALGTVLALLGLVALVTVGVQALRDGVRRVHRPRPGELLQRGGARGAVAVAVVSLLAVFVVGGAPADEAGPVSTTPGRGCNGHVELCDRAYDDVAFPATHNSMAAADEPGWFFAEQPDGIISQLDQGIRVLLVDSWYGQRTSRPGVIANTDADRARAVADLRSVVGAAALRSALRLRDAADLRPRGAVRPYLCHGLCEFGSTDWLAVMREVAAWVRAHPREVVTFFIQDQVSPADTAALVRQAGLLPFVHTQVAGEPWPTLGSMIDSGRRVVFLMENQGGGEQDPWLLDGFDWVQDTPFLFRTPAELSCAANRGPADAPLFLVNHWITDKAREVSSARAVNARAVLLPRLEQCRSERGQLPNFVAVDFYDQGDLLGAVDTLNGF